ncbi:hypothetical protein F4777DRAFT_559329 [Nemania sp. FL0916]|nr:hypothetical protein F4777DRAFT_559329 [Nemania sp. FL0916]
MADVEAAIAAAMSAAAPSAPLTPTPPTPTSPIIKTEPLAGDAMLVDCEPPLPPPPPPPPPPQLPPSPQPQLKRSRSPDDHALANGLEDRDEKRLKVEPAADNDEIARMVQAVQASVMSQFLSAPEPEPEPQSGVEYKPDPESELEPAPEHVPVPVPVPVPVSQIEAKSEPEPDPAPISGPTHHTTQVEQPDNIVETTENEQANIEMALEAALEEQRSLSVDMDVDLDMEPRPDTLWNNPRDYTRRKHIIPALGALALDILIALSEQTLEDTIATLMNDSDSEISREYAVLREAFDLQRRQLLPPSEATSFLDAAKLGIEDQTREAIRVANLASTCASIFGLNDITLEDINKHFLRIFVPEGRALSHDAAELYLGLKTQLFLAVLDSGLDRPKEEFLDEVFVTDVESSLRAHHPYLPLTVSELDFISNSKARRAMLSVASVPANSLHTLSNQFTYEAFLDTLSTYLNDNISNIEAQVAGKMEVKASSETPPPMDNATADLTTEFDLNAAIAEASRAAAEAALPPGGDELPTFDDLSAFLTENVSRAVEQSRQAAISTEMPSTIASAAESASRATALALESIAKNQYQPTALPHASDQAQSHANQQSYQSQQTQPSQYYPIHQQSQLHAAANTHANYQTPHDHLPPNQSDSTPALYERARQAAAARSSNHARREGSNSTRRPWSPEEEKALMMGLDMVKGPHWSQILSLFGPNGSISQILADRTQVQLKDKARNLKLFFLKLNSEMPYYLQCVTGELKTRAPTQAARKEAEEKARVNSEERQAHVNGILALAGGLQNNAGQRSASSTTVANNSTVQQSLHPHPPASNLPRQPPQAIVSAQPPRPVIPAPQPVSLPTLTPTSQQQHIQSAAVQQQPTPQPTSQLGNTQVTQEFHKMEEPLRQQQDAVKIEETTNLLEHNGLSIEDQALLALKAAMEEGESAAESQPATALPKQEEHVTSL